jgi:CheY-like chemotaxis protein
MTAQNMGRKILSESGYDVTTVSNGAAAVKKIAEIKPDLVILDIYMPGYTGLEVCERVRANFDTANLPVLLTVGKMEPYRAEDGAKVRADGVIVKPFEATDLLAVVKKLSEKISAVPVRHVVEEEPNQEETTFQQFSQPEHAMPSHVEVPAEIAVAPALAMEEFNTGEASAFASPAMSWSAQGELDAGHAVPAEANQFADMPWSFDQPASVEAPVAESSAVAGVEPSHEVEFTSAPRVGAVEVEQAPELEATKHDPSIEAEHSQEPSLSNAQEITGFATSFGIAQEVESHAAKEPEVAAADSNWNGWAHADPEPVEATKPEGVIDDFEAKVAAAMSGFSTEPVEPAHEAAPSELAAQPVDDFEARVAAAMSGFATESVPAAEEHVAHTPESVSVEEIHHEEPAADDFEARVAAAMSGFGGSEAQDAQVHEPVVEEVAAEPQPEPAQDVSAPPVSADDFDARLAEAMAGFDHTPESLPAEVEAVKKPEEETQEFDIPELPRPAINLNETMVLPQEAVLSLEEEMKRAMEQHAPAVEEAHMVEAEEPAPATISWEPPQPEVHESEVIHEVKAEEPDVVHAISPETFGEFDPMHVEHEVESVLHHESAPVEAAAITAPLVSPAANSNGSEKFAEAIHRAIERLKPQLIAEIVKELKGE